MKRTLAIVATLALAVALLPVLAFGDEPKSKDEACKILGNCADETVAAAEQMRAQCAKMMNTANGMIAKAMQVKTRGQMWGDKVMEAEGDVMLANGQKMLDEAKRMDDQCKLIIDSAKKSKQKAAEIQAQGSKDKGKVEEPKL